MVSLKWLPSGALPCFHLLSQEETELEEQTSELYFDSSKFADLRAQIRLKLSEASHSNQRDSPAVYWEALEVCDEYLPYLLALRQYHAARHLGSPALPHLLTKFPPLFYGFGEMNLQTDRLVGKDQRARICIPVELVLLLFTMAQLHAMHAESQIQQSSQFPALSSLSAMQHAEMSWQSAETFFRWTALYSRDAAERIDPVSGTVRHFFNAMAVYASILSHMCTVHRISTHVSTLVLLERSQERLSRLVSACARRARTIVCEAADSLKTLPQNRLCNQLRWCLNAYDVRWKAIYFDCELQIYHLDANSEIAVYFCNELLGLRLPQLPPSSPGEDSWFVQAAHELQLLHHSHLTEAVGHKKSLLNACRERFGVTWTFQMPDKRLLEELFAVRKLSSVFYAEQRAGDDGVVDGECNYLAEMIAVNVEEAALKTEENPAFSAAVPNKLPSTRDDQHQPSFQPSEHDESSTEAFNELKKRPSSASQPTTRWITMNYGGKSLHFESSDVLGTPQTDANEVDQIGNNRSDIRRTKPRPSSSPCYLSSKSVTKANPNSAEGVNQLDNTKIWARTRAPCALCERRFMRSSLPGVVVMKRIYDLRRKWGVVIPEVLAFEDRRALEQKSLDGHQHQVDKDAEFTRIIHNSITYQWHQQPANRPEDSRLHASDSASLAEQKSSTSNKQRKISLVGHKKLASALYFDPERAEKRRISRLYARFKSLLDSRVKYIVPDGGDTNGGTPDNDDQSPPVH